MDLKTQEPITALQAQGLAEVWHIQGKPGYRLTPKSAGHVAQLLHWAQEQSQKIALTLAHAALLPDACWLDLSNLHAVRQYPVDDFVIQVETGMTYGALRRQLAAHWQCLPISYPDDKTLIEILAQDEPALESGLQGFPRDFVLKTEIATPDGQLTISGADVVKNVTGYDLAKLYVGGQHAFGVLTSVTLKLSPLPRHYQHWLYVANSSQEACVLAERLLSSHLPLSLCEVFQHGRQWRILIEIAGDDWTLVEYQPKLNALSAQFSSAQAPQRLTEEAGQTLKHQLQSWSTEETLVEIALPISKMAEFTQPLTGQTTFADMRIQLRPAAGLVGISAPLFPSGSLRYLQTEAIQHQGFMQLRQIARSDVANFYEAMALYEEFNLPTDPSVRRLLKDLKKGYDPGGILYTPALPL